MKKAILIFISVVVLTVAGVFAYIWLSSDTESNLTVQLVVPERVQIGVPFEMRVALANSSNQQLRDTLLSILLPTNITLVTTSTNKNIENKKLGVIDAGSQKIETFTAIAVGSENTVRQVKAVVSYLPGTINSRFEQNAVADIVIAESGMTTDLKTPTKVLSGEVFDVELAYRNTSGKDFNNVEIRLESPKGFIVKQTSAAQIAPGVWGIGTVKKDEAGKIIVSGVLTGQDEAVFPFKMTVRSGIGDKLYPVRETVASVTISPSPLFLSIKLDGASGKSGAVVAGDRLTYTFTYENNTDIALKDVIIYAQLSGDMFDVETLSTNASFRRQDTTLIWNASQVPVLASVAPGDSGKVSFVIRAKSPQPITRLSSKNFVLKVAGLIESPTVPRFVSGSKITGLAEIETKVRGQFTLDTAGYYRDQSGIINTGLPPQVGKKTTYNVHWVIKNNSTDLADVSMKAFLGPNVRFTGKAQSTNGVLPTYNERTQEISWAAGSIPATKGILSPPAEAIFQVELIPSLDQAGNYPVLVRDTTATATDTFTGETLTYKANSLTTSLPDDKSVQSNERVVRN